MLAEDWIALFKTFPDRLHANLVVTMQNGMDVSLDTIFRCDPAFVLVRGRMAGTTDTGRLYCLPYSEICYLRWEKDVNEEEVRSVFGEIAASFDHRVRVDDADAPKPPPTIAAPAAAADPSKPAAASPAANRQALLEQLRARRAGSGPPGAAPS